MLQRFVDAAAVAAEIERVRSSIGSRYERRSPTPASPIVSGVATARSQSWCPNKSGNRAMLTATRRASSSVSTFACGAAVSVGERLWWRHGGRSISMSDVAVSRYDRGMVDRDDGTTEGARRAAVAQLIIAEQKALIDHLKAVGRDTAGVVVANPMWNQPFNPDVFANDPFDRFRTTGGVTTGKGDWAWLQELWEMEMEMENGMIHFPAAVIEALVSTAPPSAPRTSANNRLAASRLRGALRMSPPSSV